jgi:hypothetical protein
MHLSTRGADSVNLADGFAWRVGGESYSGAVHAGVSSQRKGLKKMKFIVLGLCLIVIPTFASTSSCPQTQYSSLVGCQALDSLLASISTGSVATSADDTSNFAASLLSPESTSQPVAVVPPSSALPANTNPLSLLGNSFTASSLNPESLIGYNPSPQVSITSSDTSLANQLVMDQVSLASLIVPTEFLNLSQGLAQNPNSFNFLSQSGDPSVPEMGSIGMIGSGLIALSFAATMNRSRKRLGD